MDRETRPTERLADASFLEELLRGRRALVVSSGDSAPAQHLARRLGSDIQSAEWSGGKIPGADRSLRALVVLGGFEDPGAVEALIAEARRLLAPDGVFAVSWVDATRPSLEAPPDAAGPKALAPTDAERRLAARFAHVAVVARKPYLGFQYVSGTSADDALTFDTSLTGGVPEQPTGFLAIASDVALPLADALIQVPYDPVVQRVTRWLRSAPAPAAGAAPKSGPTVVRRRDAGDDTDRLRTEVTALRDRAQSAVEESDRSRGEARAAREKAALLEAEVLKLRARLKGAPDPENERIRADLEQRTRERDQAAADAAGAATELTRALETAARLERDADFLQERLRILEGDASKAKESREQAAAALKVREEEAERLRNAAERAAETLERAKEERKRLEERASSAEKKAREAEEQRAAAEKRAKELEEKGAGADGANAEREKRIQDLHRRAEQALKRQQDAEKRMSELESAKFAAERAAEDAWKRLKETQEKSSPAPATGAMPADLVPHADLQAAQQALAAAIARAESAEKEQRRLSELADGARTSTAAKAEIDDLQRALEGVNEELAAARRRADDAELRAAAAAEAAAEANARLQEARAAASSDDGLRSLLHQRETALEEAQERAKSLEAKAGRFAAESSEALAKARAAEETLATRDAELAKALKALEGVESREQRDKELIAELRGEVARLTEALDAAREDQRKASITPVMASTAEDLVKERDRAVEAAAKAQADAARVHADADALRERLDRTNDELTRLLAEQKKAEEHAAEKEKRIADLEAELLPLKSGAKGAAAAASDVERRSVQMSQRISLLEAELERAKDDVKQATAEARKYRALAEAMDPPADRVKG